jgi:hypothetical protein
MLVRLWLVFFVLLAAVWGGANLLAHGAEVVGWPTKNAKLLNRLLIFADASAATTPRSPF